MKRKVQTAALVGLGAVGGLGVWDKVQKKHSILRNYPVAGHLRFLMEEIRPEIQQYFVENNYDGRPFDRDTRTMVYERAKGLASEKAFGTERRVTASGYNHLLHTAAPVEIMDSVPRVRLGGPDCRQPYDISLFNISSMSFGALSDKAILAMNKGAAMGGFVQETGEGGLTKYHLAYGADIIWEFGSSYFGCRDENGNFDPEIFREKSNYPQVKGILIKLSQGAKPGLGGQLPAAKVTAEIAEARGVPEGKDCFSPPAHSAFHTPVELMEFIGQLRELSNGKPIGIKLCVGPRTELLAMCKAMIETGITPDWITVDGSEGGTGAAPLEFVDQVGTPLTEGIVKVHNALVGAGLREKIAIGCSGKIVGGADIVRRIALGADFTNSARGMMMAVGCIQAQKCHTNKCPVGVATQDKKRSAAIDVEDKARRVCNYQQGTVQSAMRILASMGLHSFEELGPEHVVHRIDATHTATYDKLYEWLEPDCLIDGSAPATWFQDWNRVDSQSFTIAKRRHQRPIAKAEHMPASPRRQDSSKDKDRSNEHVWFGGSRSRTR